VVTVVLVCGLGCGAVGAHAQVKTAPDTTIAAPMSAPQKARARDRARRLAAASSGPIVDAAGCTANVLGANDDGSTDSVTLPFGLDFFGTSYSSLYVNNNGNVTFNEPLGEYTPYELTASVPPIIAPFFADVDTRGAGSGLMTYGATTFQGHSAFCVNWLDVGYYGSHTDKLDSFQLLLVNRADSAAGDFDIVFNYGQLDWETGDASGGSGGLGGTSAGAGYSNGDGNAGHFFQMPGSLVNGALLDDASTGLIHGSEGSATPGRYVFHVTSGGQGGSTLDGLARDWPSAGYGYKFVNEGLGDWLYQTSLSRAAVYNDTTLGSAFSDWGRRSASARSQQIDAIARLANGGLCFGMALSAGRFDELVDPLASGPAGRSDPIWAEAGTGPYASVRLRTPGPEIYDGATDTYNREMISLLAVDWATQLSTQVASSLQRQFLAYADRTSGVRALAAQLASVMRTGHDGYDNSSKLDGAANSGFAMISMFDVNRREGHEVLAYSAQSTESGGVAIDVWDNNFPGVPHTITINSDGTWTYDATYQNGFLSDTMSLSGSGGHTQGKIAVLPLYTPTGLSYSPQPAGGLGTGSMVDLPAGTDVTDITDSAGEEPEIQFVASDGIDHQYAGQIVTLPSDAGSVTITGDHPALDVRGADTFIMVAGSNSSPLTVSTDEHGGNVDVAGGAAGLSVARDDQVVKSSGAGGLTLAPDGSVAARGLTGPASLTIDFDHDGGTATATLFQGDAPASGQLSFTAPQIADAQQAAVQIPQSPLGTLPAVGPAGSGLAVVPKVTPTPKPKPKPKPLTRAQKLAKALKKCAKIKRKAKRHACVTAAKKRYAKKPKSKKRKK
jgi:hypothetical protein